MNALRDQLVAMQPLYPRLTLPVELLHGTADTIVPLTIHSEPLSHILPNARLTVLDGSIDPRFDNAVRIPPPRRSSGRRRA